MINSKEWLIIMYCISLNVHALFNKTAAQKSRDHLISEALWQFPVTRTIHITSQQSVVKGCIELCSFGSYGQLYALFFVLHLPHCNLINIFIAFCSFFAVAYPRIFFFLGGGGSTNSVEDRGQTERGSGGGSPLLRSSTQFANEWNPYSDSIVPDVFSTELEIRLSFVKTLEFRGV
jgi:hypothetical protein